MAVQDSSGRWVSRDGWYWWDGRAWQPTRSQFGCAQAAFIAGLLLLAVSFIFLAILTRLLDDQHVVMAAVAASVAVALALIAGRVAPQAWTQSGALTELGMSMVVSCWVAAAGLSWAYLVAVVKLVGLSNPSFSEWALGTWLLSPTASIALISGGLLFGTLDLWNVRPGPSVPFRWSTAGGDMSGFGDGGNDWDARAIALAVLAGIAASFAILTVWLLARAISRSRGVRLSFSSAFFGRSPARSQRLQSA